MKFSQQRNNDKLDTVGKKNQYNAWKTAIWFIQNEEKRGKGMILKRTEPQWSVKYEAV